MKDGKEYSVTIADTTKTFTATDNKIVAVNVTPATVPYATLTTVSAIAVDTQGVELGSANLGDATLAGKTIEFTVTPAVGGYTSAAQLYLAKKGDTAKAKVTIKSGEYDATGKEINNIDSGDVTITAVDQEVVAVNGFKARVSTESKSFDEVKDATSLAIGDQGYAFFKFTNSKGDEIATTDYANYKVESSNANVLVVAEGTLSAALSGKKGSSAVNVYGVAAGTAYLIVKDTKNKDAIVATIAVTVNAKRVVDSLALDKTSLVLSTDTTVGVETVNVTVKDQYGDKMTSDYTMTCELLASPSGATTSSAPAATANGLTSVKFQTAASAKTGTYTYKVTVKSADGKIERSQVVKVDVKAPTGTVAYAFEISGLDANNTVDATLNDKFAGNKDVVIKIVETKGGVKSAYVAADKVVVKKDNKAVTVATASSAKTATFAAIATDATIATAAAAGTYVVSASVNGVNVAPVTFIVNNDTAKVTASQVKDTVVAGELKDKLGASFDFYFGAKKLDASNSSEYTIASVKATKNGLKNEVNAATQAGDIVNVTEVVLSVKFDGTNSFYITVPVNKTVKVVAQ